MAAYPFYEPMVALPLVVDAWQHLFTDSRHCLLAACNEEEHWAPMSCFCGLRRWRYDLVAKMEGDTMQVLSKVLIAKGRLPAAMVTTGWGPQRNETFLGRNRVFHRTGANEKLLDFYSKSSYPGVFAKVGIEG
jgi:hypothetical protein